MTYKELVSKYRKAHIITHTDLDGYGAGGILYQTLLEIGFDSDNIKITHTEYTNPTPFDADYDLTFISDISISEINAAKSVENYATTPGKMLFWFDHHQTSIDMYEKNPKLELIFGKRDINASGAMLCWFFYQLVKYNKSTQSVASIDEVISLMNKVNPKAILDNDKKNNGLVFEHLGLEKAYKTNISKTPIMILLTDDYDRFVLNYPESSWLMAAFNNSPNIKKDCKDTFWSKYYMNTYEMSNKYLATILKTGKHSLLWTKYLFLKSILNSGFVAGFNAKGMTDLNMLCICTTQKGSLNFGSLLKKNSNKLYYDYGCAYSHNGEKFTVSIYCTDPINRDDVPGGPKLEKVYNAADICKRFNGGGHIGAAGFVTKEISFYNKRPISEDVKAQIKEELDLIYKELF